MLEARNGRDNDMTLKYIMINESIPIIFPETMPHESIKVEHGLITSAGFIQLYERDNAIQAKVYGRSHGLRLDSHPEDTVFIEIMLGLT